MSLFVAPSARRTPISFVRSVTDTSITFMITMPPTTAEIELTIRNTAKKAPLMLLPERDVALFGADEKIALRAGRMCRRARRIIRRLILRVLEIRLPALRQNVEASG